LLVFAFAGGVAGGVALLLGSVMGATPQRIVRKVRIHPQLPL